MKREKWYYTKYHTPAGEAARLREIIRLYAGIPECVERATKTLEAHLEAHPEIAASGDARKAVADSVA